MTEDSAKQHYSETIEVARGLSQNLGMAVMYIAFHTPRSVEMDIENLERALSHVRDEMEHCTSSSTELEGEWGEKVYELARKLNVNRQEAVEWICEGSSKHTLRYAVNFIEREIEDLKYRQKFPALPEIIMNDEG